MITESVKVLSQHSLIYNKRWFCAWIHYGLSHLLELRRNFQLHNKQGCRTGLTRNNRIKEMNLNFYCYFVYKAKERQMSMDNVPYHKNQIFCFLPSSITEEIEYQISFSPAHILSLDNCSVLRFSQDFYSLKGFLRYPNELTDAAKWIMFSSILNFVTIAA